MDLTSDEIAELTAWRHALHQRPELSGEEMETARAVAQILEPTSPDQILTGLGGHGVAAIYNGAGPGPTVMFRCELDALPIEEISAASHRSQNPGKGHLCGHDGHMAILAGLARYLGRNKPRRGRAILLFQPAEENGAGSAAVIVDPRFRQIAPDYAFALHNMPGMPLGEARISVGPAMCASRGMKIALTGKTSHASAPEGGVSPMQAVANLMPALTALGRGGKLDAGFTLVTVTHAEMGERAFGIAPGYAEIWATLRTVTDASMDDLVARAEALVQREATASGLRLVISYHDVFHHCDNEAEAVAILRTAMDAGHVPHRQAEIIRASEDFGLFGSRAGAKSAMFFLGAGETSPQLHNPDYDFPDVLIGPGVSVFAHVAHDLLGSSH